MMGRALMIKTFGEPSAGARIALRRSLIYAHSRFDVYRDSMAKARISADDLKTHDPVKLIESLPILEGNDFYKLANEAFTIANEIVDLEASSGTTGHRKRRAITYSDEISESKFLGQLFRVCGLDVHDRVACLATGPLTLMVSFTRALEELGVFETYALSTGPEPAATIDDLLALDPTAIITVPSVLERCLNALVSGLRKHPHAKLRSIIYVGEQIRDQIRTVLTENLDLEIFGYYGASETSALGIECQAHKGIHLFTDQNYFEVSTKEVDDTYGQLLVTTLRQEGLPLIRYSIGDLVKMRPDDCSCGLSNPRVDVLERNDGSVSLLGIKVSYDSIHHAVYRDRDPIGPIEVLLSNDCREKITLVLPDSLVPEETSIRRSLTGKEPDIAYLFAGKFVELELVFVNVAYFRSIRKNRRIIDLRTQ